MQQQILVSGGIILKANGETVGFASELSYTRNQNTKVQYGIDSAIPQEIHPTTYLVTGNISGLAVRGMGGLDGKEIMDLRIPEKIFSQKYVTIEMVDIVSGQTIRTFTSVMFDQDSWRVSAKALVTFSGSFKAIFVTNEVSS